MLLPSLPSQVSHLYHQMKAPSAYSCSFPSITNVSSKYSFACFNLGLAPASRRTITDMKEKEEILRNSYIGK